MTIATAAEVQNDLGRFLDLVRDGNEVVIIRNGIEVAKLVSPPAVKSISDSLVGVLPMDVDDKAIRSERLRRYENPD